VPGTSYSSFVAAAGLEDGTNPITFQDHDPPPAEVTDDEASLDSDSDHPEEEDFNKDWTIPNAEGADMPSADFNNDTLHSQTMVDIDEEEKLNSLSSEILRLHHKFNHIAFDKIKALAHLGIVNLKLAHVPAPCCSSCLYGKATRRA
jgi:hypothetical protein